MYFVRKANHPLRQVGGAATPLQEQPRPQLQPVGLAVSPTTFRGLPAGGATTDVVATKQEER